MTHRYKPQILEQLWSHGIQPTPETRPDLVHDFVNDLYRYELRRLRDRLLRREVRKGDYFDLVLQVRRRYPLLALKARHWVDQ
jgi:hypothetical protein